MSLIYTSSRAVRQSSSYRLTRVTLLGLEAELAHLSQSSQSKPPSLGKKLLSWFLSLIIVVSILAGSAIFLPKLVYSFYDAGTIVFSGDVDKTALGGDVAAGPTHSTYLPEFNPNLPTESWLEIPLIDVRTLLHQTADPAEALDQGVWLDPQFGVPGEGKLVVLAAHRYGWKWWWRDEYWRYNSFYNLPETQPGDLIEITYGQRKFVYEIYLATEGEEITDFGADLILYTCKFLNSPIRYFRYARLIDPSQDSQSL